MAKTRGDDLINFKPGIADRDAFESLVFGTRQRAAPFRFVGLGFREAKGRKATRAAASVVIHFTGLGQLQFNFLGGGIEPGNPKLANLSGADGFGLGFADRGATLPVGLEFRTQR